MDAHENDPRSERILEVAMELAEANGYDAVRLRDVAAGAEVALGTVYRRFAGKEDILAAALQRMIEHFAEAVQFSPVPGDDPTERLAVFFELATQSLAERPKLASALLRTVASGEPEVAGRILAFRDAMDRIVVTVFRGHHRDDPPTAVERQLARMIQNSWFAEMVGWTGGLQTVEDALDRLREATDVVLRGLEVR